MVFTDQINSYLFGINMPDMIGWEGGQPVTLHNGTKLLLRVSGTSDLEIVLKALEKARIAVQ